MKGILTSLFVVLALGVVAQKKGFVINGKLDGFPEGTEIKLYRNGDNTELGSAKLAKGKFLMKGKVDEPVLTMLAAGNERPVELYLENANITVKGKMGDMARLKVEGSASHDDFTKFIGAFVPQVQSLNSLAGTINNTPPGKEREDLMTTYNTERAGLQGVIDDFIRNNPNSQVGPFILEATYSFNEDVTVLEKRFNQLSEKSRNSAGGTRLRNFIAQNKIGAVGTDAMDFSQPDTLGIPVALSSFRGKYVLIDFWASWCGPCRNENPTVVENFNEFRNKNFTVLGVSLDRPGQKDKWMDAIHADGLTWTHVSDLQFWSNAAAILYNVKGIPQNFLVDPQGKIIARNLRGPALREKLCEVLGCN